MEDRQGMPIMLNDKQVIIKAVRLRTYDGSYIVPHDDQRNVKLFKLQDPKMVLPKRTEWKVIWSGEDEICSFMSIHGKVLSIRGNYLMFRARLYLEPWPVLDGGADWRVQVKNTSSDGKLFLAKLKQARKITFVTSSLELGTFGVAMYGYGTYYSLVPSPGWTVEVVEGSTESEVENNTEQHRDHLTREFPASFVNYGTYISESQFVGGDYCNSGYNKNNSGSQNCGPSALR